MNKNQVKGAAKQVVGKVQEKTGQLIDSKEQQIKGLSKQVAGKVQMSIGDIQNSAAQYKKH
jgi:uncharacterized protein YjbJ (UPF0337 family)